MRIGIDCRTILNPGLGESAGVGHYTYFLVKHLLASDTKNEYVLFFDYRMNDVNEFMKPNVTIRRFAFSQYKKFLPFSYSHMLITAMLLKEKLDVMHFPANVVPLTYRQRTVITVHDLAIYKNSAWFPSQIFSTRLLVPQSLKAATHVIAVSESTKRDLQNIFDVPARKISVIYEAPFVTPINVKDKNVDVVAKFRLRQPYILYIGSLDARKNLDRLLDAFLAFRGKPQGKDVHLVLAGGKGHKAEMILDRIAHLKGNNGIQYLGYVTHNEKLALLKKASVFAFPSLYEGFGLPVLDAMKLGVPVVSSTASSLPEVAGNAAILVNPEDTAALTRALLRVFSNPQLAATMVKRGYEHAQRFTWERVAQETLAVYQRTAKKRKAKGKNHRNDATKKRKH